MSMLNYIVFEGMWSNPTNEALLKLVPKGVSYHVPAKSPHPFKYSSKAKEKSKMQKCAKVCNLSSFHTHREEFVHIRLGILDLLGRNSQRPHLHCAVRGSLCTLFV